MNKLFITGNLTADPEVRSTPSGTTVCTFTVAVNRRFSRSDSGERATDFFRVNAWRQLGDNCGRYLAKGRKVAVVGELQARLYEAKNGETRMSLDVNADEVEFLSSPGQSQEGGYSQSGYTSQSSSRQNDDDIFGKDGFSDIQSDDIPF